MGKNFEIGLIRVLTSDDQHFVDTHGRQIMENFPGLNVESRCIPDQWEGIHSPETLAIAKPKIVALAKEFADKDMILVSCADDPAVEEIKAELPGMPVTGGGETTLALAGFYSDKIAILGITDYPPKAYLEMAGERLIAVGKPVGVDSTLDLLKEEGKKNIIACAKELKEKGAGVIALACTGLSTIGIAKLLEKEVGIPVIDPVMAEGTFAYFEAIRKK